MNKKTGNSIELIFCSFDPVGLNDYVDYFAQVFYDFTYLRWKFPHSRSSVKSAVITYSGGKKTGQKDLPSPYVFTHTLLYFLFLPVSYFHYVIHTTITLWPRRTDKKRIFMGVNYFCTFCGLVLKKMGRVDFVIYRVMDFFPLPTKGIYRVVNRIFFLIDKYCINRVDEIWFTTMGHIEGREKYGYFDRKKYNYKLIPLGMDTRKFVCLPAEKVDGNALVYCGVISKYHLLDILFETIFLLKKSHPHVVLHIIGNGPDESYFKKLAGEMNMKKNVIFHGYIKEGGKLTDLVSGSLAGIALYKDVEDFMKYTEPAKVKYYLNFGIPAIVSKVPLIAKQLHEQKVSFAVNNNPEEIAAIVNKLAKDQKLLQLYKNNIKKLVKELDIKILLSKLFTSFLETKVFK